ncbi:AAA family ATPase [Niveibacterium terrae]|uniref:AAA family ATPase n=1 Tax=Niveibacterium terrae TaxID=3373598 RepID=UPI003A9192BE
MAEIVLCCGKVCSGKSTYARRLEAERGFLLLSADEWMLRLNGEIADREEFADKLSRCKALIADLALDLLARGIDVVLDSGFWTREERTEARALFAKAGHRVSLLHFALPDERQRANLATRNGGPAGFHYAFDEATVLQLNRLFEAPDEDEGALSPAEHSESLGRTSGQGAG